MVYRKEYFSLTERRDHHINFQELLYRTAGNTQKDPFVQRASCFSLEFTVNYVVKTVFIYQVQTQAEALENLPNEYTIKTYNNTYNELYDGHLL